VSVETLCAGHNLTDCKCVHYAVGLQIPTRSRRP
jgi:hypothetical protein